MSLPFPKTTRAAVLYAAKKPLRVEALKIPALRPGQVLVQIAVAGFCRSQLNEILGLKGADAHLPHTLGHEGAGRVVAAGKGVRKVKEGDRVVLTWIRGAGRDVPCARYQSTGGRFVNSGAVSTFLEYAVVSENRVVCIPSQIPFKEAALLGCAVLTGAGMVLRTLKMKPRQTLAVFGTGGVGLSVVAAARLAGARAIAAVDKSPQNLVLARRLGATHTHLLNKAENSLLGIMKVTSGRGFDYAVEASGDTRAMENAFSSVRDHGGICLIAGNPAFGRTLRIDPFFLIQGKKILGSWGGDARPDEDVPRYAALYLKKRLNLAALAGAEYPLDRINDAVTAFQKGRPGRILIRMPLFAEV